MKISKAGVSLIKEFEGCSLTAYWDVDAYSIGYGHHSKAIQKGTKITEEDAEAFLISDLERFEKLINQYDHIYHFNQNEFDALVSFAYNVGSINQLTNFGKRTRETIALKIPQYCKAGGVTLRALQRRRQAEAKLFTTKVEVIEELDGYYPAYEGDSVALDEILKAIGADADFDTTKSNYMKRYPIAKANGIKGYKGSASQNISLKNLAKDGRLRRPS